LTENFEKAIENKTRHVVGTSSVFLDGVDMICRYKECNMGNFITDSFVNYVSCTTDDVNDVSRIPRRATLLKRTLDTPLIVIIPRFVNKTNNALCVCV